MKQDVKKKWVKALRSGEYRQTTSVLRNEWNEFCCLGVLCDLAVEDGQDVDFVGIDSDGCWEGHYNNQTELPDTVVMSWAELNGFKIEVTNSSGLIHEQYNLYDLNDSGEFTFDQIADLIEYFL